MSACICCGKVMGKVSPDDEPFFTEWFCTGACEEKHFKENDPGNPPVRENEEGIIDPESLTDWR